MPLDTEISRVAIRDYKSIATCDVDLGPLTFLVGPNGSGKSNFLDALRFVADSLNHSVEQAIRDRGGINDVRRRSEGRPRHFAIKLEFRRPAVAGSFAFEIGDRAGGGFTIKRETCEISFGGPGKPRKAVYEAERGKVVRMESSFLGAAEVPNSTDRFLLSSLSALPDFRPAWQAFAPMGFYRLNPDKIRDLQSPESGDILTRDGSNAAAVLANLAKHHEDVKARVEEFLAMVAPGTLRVMQKTLGPKETLEFEQAVTGANRSRRFLAANMSDGTLGALGILLALFQSPNGGKRVSLIGVEEPETALHPAAAAVLLDALLEASQRRQVIVTSHSPDLLDSRDLPADAILAVSAEDGTTSIAPIGPSERSVIKRRLKTPGEMLRNNQLTPDLKRVPSPARMRLFQE